MGTVDSATWRKSSYSGTNGNCVEAGALGPGQVLVRDTMDPAWPLSAPVIAFSADAWRKFADGLK
jgi:hypothetical protein